MTPAVPPLPTIWNLPFQPSLGIHTSNRTAGVVTPTTRQIGTAIVPTGFGFTPAGSISVSVIVVSAMLSLVLRSAQAMGFAASDGIATSAPAASNSALCSFMIAPLWLSVHAMSVLAVMVVIVIVVISVIVMMIVILCEILAQPLGGAVAGVARQHIARGSLCDQAIRVLLEQEAFADLLSGGVPHYAVVPLLAAVALLDRAARIPARHARGLGHGERNIAGGQIAFVALQRPARDPVPAGLGPPKRF